MSQCNYNALSEQHLNKEKKNILKDAKAGGNHRDYGEKQSKVFYMFPIYGYE
jgi:hypothetical protein